MSRRPSRLRISRSKVALAALAAALAIPALGQDKPESILPPGFGDPTPAPSAPRPRAVQPIRPDAAATPVARPVGPVIAPTLPDAPDAEPTPLETPTPTATPPAATDFAAFVRADMPA